ncbi:cupin domain-containing protein [Methylocella sp. CPCC 101449]|uniref:helix-turn-helix domain-containing protein n=1 Tax=Methylocella sp. CPCC 101449 TaxID=2987531 RepID=UPI00289236A3|nr:cupin domain-containing protein [Methylocella sp. CPCC 101449]MDT2022564.1 cupin domain-containing protein [Methylocella sp. CPCC 101449]HEV2572707.1 cupin domain-containing protein [Beijerinckiaceae bacterium]
MSKNQSNTAEPLQAAASDDAAKTLIDVGRRIRQLRQQRNMTLQHLAQTVGLSPAMLSLVERGLVSPSLTSLAAMAHGFGISLTDLIAGRSSDDDEPVSRLSEQPVVETPDRVRRWVLREDQLRRVDVTVNEYPPGVGNSPNGLRHSGHEYGFVLEGVLTVIIDGVHHVLRTGDLISLQSTRLHRIWNFGTAPAKALWFNLGRDDWDKSVYQNG